MLVQSTKYKKSISSQVRLLELLFKFRFLSVPLLSEYLEKDKSTVYERLSIVVKQGYVQKAYDSSYRLPPKPATYSLASKGIAYLRNNNQEDTYSEVALRNMYKNRSASLQLVDHSLNVFKLCLLLRSHYPNTFEIFTQSELSAFDDIIRPRPDLYLRRVSRRSTKPNYQLEIIEAGTFTWILKKRLQAHQNFYDEHEEWEDTYPALLFVCGNPNTEKRIQKIASGASFDFAVYTTTLERLDTNIAKAWVTNYDPDWDDEMECVGLQ